MLAILVLLLWILAGFGLMIVHGSGGVIVAKAGLLLIPLVWVVVTAMFVRMTPPVGRIITRKDAPALFDLVDGENKGFRSRFKKVPAGEIYSA